MYFEAHERYNAYTLCDINCDTVLDKFPVSWLCLSDRNISLALSVEEILDLCPIGDSLL